MKKLLGRMIIPGPATEFFTFLFSDTSPNGHEAIDKSPNRQDHYWPKSKISRFTYNGGRMDQSFITMPKQYGGERQVLLVAEIPHSRDMNIKHSKTYMNLATLIYWNDI